jgi:hypothetical protein
MRSGEPNCSAERSKSFHLAEQFRAANILELKYPASIVGTGSSSVTGMDLQRHWVLALDRRI